MKKPFIVLMQMFYWFIFLFLALLLISATWPENLTRSFKNFLLILSSYNILVIYFLPAITGFYGCYLFLFPKFLLKNRFFSAAIIAVVFSSLFSTLVFMYLGFIRDLGISMINIELLGGILLITILMLINAVIALLMKGFITWYNELKLKEELNKKNFETELELIKSQINPHFLFNTINNIDSLILLHPQKASAYLNKLSDIMRFMLHETKTDFITLEKEITYIEKYIDLQKIRTANPDYVTYSLTGNTEGVYIAPMLFIPFIENAFKHAERKGADEVIAIHITIKNGTITFECANNYVTSLHKLNGSGLGNELIEKRLMLLYPQNHQLTINYSNNYYHVNLSITPHAHKLYYC